MKLFTNFLRTMDRVIMGLVEFYIGKDNITDE